MTLVLISKAADQASAEVSIVKFVERLQIEDSGDALCVLEFIVQVEPNSPRGLTKLDVICPHDISDVENVTETFSDSNMFENKGYTGGFRCLDSTQKKYCIDGIVTFLTSLSSDPILERRRDFTNIRLSFREINPGESMAFRLKMSLPKIVKNNNSLEIFELSVYPVQSYWTIPIERIETWKEWVVMGIPINRSLCEIWVILPEENVFRWSIPTPQQIRIDNKYLLLCNDKLDISRSAVYWDLEADVFDLPGREVGDYIAPNKGVRIYCETTKPHVTPETFNSKMGTALDEINNLQQNASKAEKSLNFIANYGKQSFIITLVLSLIAIIIAVISTIL